MACLVEPMARTEPRPPSEQPVIRTVALAIRITLIYLLGLMGGVAAKRSLNLFKVSDLC
jgi:hypothetical protein